MTDSPRPDRGKDSKGRPARAARVVGRETISEHLVRLTLHCPELQQGILERPPFTDAYVKLELADAAGDVVLRTYTVRNWRPEVGEFDLDFVVHGDEGVAGPWAREVEIGTEVTFRGPGGGYAPSSDAGLAHLFVGDLSALPAIEEALKQVPAGNSGLVVIATTSKRDARELATHLPVTWVVADALPEALERAAEAVEQWTPEGEVECFVHGEAGMVRRLRRHLRVDRQVALQRQSISGYWRLGTTDEGWRQQKKDWLAPVDEAEAAVIQP